MRRTGDRIVDWQPPEDQRSPGQVARGRVVAWMAAALLVVLAANALAGWVGRADERRAQHRAVAVEQLFVSLNEGDRDAYLAGGLDRVARAGITWGFLRTLGEDDPPAPRPGDTSVSATCTGAGAHVVRCDLRQGGGPFAGLDTRARGYFLVDDAGAIRRSWIELVADEQRLATFLRELRTHVAEHHPAVHRAVFDTTLPFLHRRAFHDTLTNRRLLTDVLAPRPVPRR